MSFISDQFREHVVRPALRELERTHKVPYSAAAEELLMLTAAAESLLGRYLVQFNGPALGVFQIEPATAAWLIRRFKLNGEVGRVLYDLWFAAQVARMRYWVVPQALPYAEDITALAQYYKDYYNTRAGRASVAGAIQKYQNYVTDGVWV